MPKQSLLDENIISILGLEKLPDEQKLALLDKMSGIAQKRIASRVFDQLESGEQDAFMDATAAGDEGKIQALLGKKGIDMARLIQEEVLKLKEEMKDTADAAHL